jgi:hypothetical protein
VRVWVRQEDVLHECKAHELLLKPFLFIAGIYLMARVVSLELPYVVSEEVVGDDESLMLLGKCNSVRVVVVLRWCLHEDTLLGQ